MKKLILLIALAIFCIYSAHSQDIASSIRNYEPSKSELISKGRNLVMDFYIAGDIEKVTEAFLYLNTKVADNNYAAFTAFEQIYLGSLTQNYAYSLAEILRLDSLSKVEHEMRTRKVQPIDKQLGAKLFEFSYIYLQKIYKQIEVSKLTDEDKGMLKLTLNDIFDNSNVPQNMRQKAQDDINQQCDSFLTKFKDSKYEHYVRNQLRRVFKQSDWGFGEEGSLGYMNTQGKTQNYLSDGFGFAFGFDGYYKRLAMFLRGSVFINQVKTNIPFEDYTTLYAGTTANLGIGEFSLGYTAIDTKNIVFTPFAGIGGNFLDPTDNTIENDPRLKNKEIASFCYLAGVNCDIKFKNTASYAGYTALRLRLSYVMPTSTLTPFQGNQLTFMIGYCLVGRSTKRDL